MAESSPRHNLLAEALDRLTLARKHPLSKAVRAHLLDLGDVSSRPNPQHFDCDITALMFPSPHISTSTTEQRGIRSIVTHWDLECSWEQTLATTYPTQQSKAFLPEARWELWEAHSLSDVNQKFENGGTEGNEPHVFC